MHTLVLSLARAGLVVAAATGRLPFTLPGEAGSEADHRLGRPHWHRSAMRLAPGVMWTAWSEVARRVITRIGVRGLYDSLVLPAGLAVQLRLQSLHATGRR